MDTLNMFDRLKASLLAYDLAQVKQAQSRIDEVISTVFYQNYNDESEFNEGLEDCHHYNVV